MFQNIRYGKGIKAAAMLAIVLAATLFGCKAPEAARSSKPVRAAVFVDNGARNIGAFRWLEITGMSPDMVSVPVDGAAIRAGALDNVDVLVMPGGRSVSEAEMLGAEGREKVKKFIREGGSYIGTCAGCCMVMQPSKCHPNMLGILPWTFGPSGGRADMLVEFSSSGASYTGVKKGVYRLRYAEGPVPVPSKRKRDPLADIKVVATYASDINSVSAKPREPFTGKPAAFAGTYGKGRIFVTTVHPESDVDDHDILRKAFKFLTGVDVNWEYPQRKRGALAVGFMCDNSFGVETGRFIVDLLKSGEFDVYPLNKGEVADGALHRLDAVLVPDVAKKGADLSKGLYGDNLGQTKAFVERGGLVVAWGESAKAKEIADGVVAAKVAKSGEDALAIVREWAKTPVREQAGPPAKIAKPVKMAVYADDGGVNYTVTSVLKYSPEYEVSFLDANDICEGKLAGFDILLQPGGGSTTQYNKLGKKGAKAIVDFVRNGGAYYGICAGAFLATQQSSKGKPRTGMCPYKSDEPEHYRGWGPIKVRMTDEGAKVFDGDRVREMTYWGGPVLVPGDPVADADVKVLGKYAGRLINTSSKKPVKDMYGKGAFVGGKVGKGKVFLSCPHPEKSEYNRDIVLNILKYLTGVKPTVVERERTRGAASVFFKTAKTAPAGTFFCDKLICDSRFDTRSNSSLNRNLLPHVDAIIFASFDKEDLSGEVQRFIDRGGKVVLVADDPKKKKLASTLKGATVVDSFDKIIPLLLL